MAAQRVGERIDPYSKYLEQLQEIRRFGGEPAKFWPEYLDLLVKLSEAKAGIIAVVNREQRVDWRVLAASYGPALTQAGVPTLIESMNDVAEQAQTHGHTWTLHGGSDVLLASLDTGGGAEICIAALVLGNVSKGLAREAAHRVMLVSDVPASYQLQRMARDARVRVDHFAGVMDLMVLLNEQKRFLAGVMTLANELAFRLRCERVSVGWLERGYIRMKAISHVDRFDRKSDAVQRLEETMEEALDQDTEIIYPPASGAGTIYTGHRDFSRTFDVPHVCSVPLRVDGEAVAVCTCERSTEAFTDTDIRLLRLALDQASRRLGDLRKQDRWFGARFAQWLKEKLGKLIGYEHTWAKVIGLLVAVGLGVLIFGQASYRIKAPVILRTDNVAYLTAPFDGHIQEVTVKVGDTVEAGTPVLTLDESDMRLQEAALVAERNRYQREFEKSRAQNSLADMRINQAQVAQVSARLDLVRHQLGQSVVRAAFEGVIVEGNQRERLGAPVEQGNTLFKLARVEQVYAELEVSESDVHELRGDQTGEMALAARPQLTYPIRVTRVEPVAVAKDDGNVFVVQCEFPEGYQEWWRPGMTGVAKLDAGKRRIIWILTHRTVDFLRLRLWW